MPQKGLTGGREVLTPSIVSDQKIGGIPKEQERHRGTGLAGPKAVSQFLDEPRSFGNPDPIGGRERRQQRGEQPEPECSQEVPRRRCGLKASFYCRRWNIKC